MHLSQKLVFVYWSLIKFVFFFASQSPGISKLCKRFPGGGPFLTRSAEAEAKENSVGWAAKALTPFVMRQVVKVRPAAKSHKRTVESIDPVMTCGSHSLSTRT